MYVVGTLADLNVEFTVNNADGKNHKNTGLRLCFEYALEQTAPAPAATAKVEVVDPGTSPESAAPVAPLLRMEDAGVEEVHDDLFASIDGDIDNHLVATAVAEDSKAEEVKVVPKPKEGDTTTGTTSPAAQPLKNLHINSPRKGK